MGPVGLFSGLETFTYEIGKGAGDGDIVRTPQVANTLRLRAAQFQVPFPTVHDLSSS